MIGLSNPSLNELLSYLLHLLRRGGAPASHLKLTPLEFSLFTLFLLLFFLESLLFVSASFFFGFLIASLLLSFLFCLLLSVRIYSGQYFIKRVCLNAILHTICLHNRIVHINEITS